MTKKLLFILAVTFAFSAKAQNIPNAGFESWTPGFGYDDPNSWGTLNALSILGMPISVTKSTERHGGSFSAKVETMSTTDSTGQETPSPGVMFIGSVDLFQQSFINGTSFTARPDSLRGVTVRQLGNAGFQFHQLVMGIGREERILINNNSSKDEERNRALAVPVKRDAG